MAAAHAAGSGHGRVARRGRGRGRRRPSKRGRQLHNRGVELQARSAGGARPDCALHRTGLPRAVQPGIEPSSAAPRPAARLGQSQSHQPPPPLPRRVYAYTTSAVQVSILRLFVRCDVLLPNLFVGTITRESAMEALKSGIDAKAIIGQVEGPASPGCAGTLAAGTGQHSRAARKTRGMMPEPCPNAASLAVGTCTATRIRGRRRARRRAALWCLLWFLTSWSSGTRICIA